jgi:hypothetical protein
MLTQPYHHLSISLCRGEDYWSAYIDSEVQQPAVPGAAGLAAMFDSETVVDKESARYEAAMFVSRAVKLLGHMPWRRS